MGCSPLFSCPALAFVSHTDVIEIGPYTVLTVDEGYAAITQNNGLQVVLDGGMTHLLTHQVCNQPFTDHLVTWHQTFDLSSSYYLIHLLTITRNGVSRNSSPSKYRRTTSRASRLHRRIMLSCPWTPP
mmetsp:Transcript_2700/g.7064  ORF Transcript_2700/g.7064 Transcript_2700/m.7064 type:complete len:128 (+) Transcript_2700:52-435(+)